MAPSGEMVEDMPELEPSTLVTCLVCATESTDTSGSARR